MRDWRHGDSVFLWAFDLIEQMGIATTLADI
jgi:hypothetical protein